jgi:hypothetical protein
MWTLLYLIDFLDIIYRPLFCLRTMFQRLDSAFVLSWAQSVDLVPISGELAFTWGRRQSPVSETLFLNIKQDDGNVKKIIVFKYHCHKLLDLIFIFILVSALC